MTRAIPIAARAAPAALVVCCLVILLWALLRATAAWNFMQARAGSEPWFGTGIIDGPAPQNAQAHLDSALRYFSSNPDYLHLGGRLAALRAHQPGVAGAERRALLENAAASFRQALEARPRWPYSWAGLLSVKDAAGKVDDGFRTALRQSALLGPWEPAVQLQVIRSGVRSWSGLADYDRGLVRNTIENALRVQPRQVFAIVKGYGRADLICDRSNTHIQIRRWCESVMW